MFIIFSQHFSTCLILLSVFLVSEIISFPEVSEEDEPYREYTHPPSKLKHDYGNVSTKLVIFDTDKTIWPFSTEDGNIFPPLTKAQGDVIIDKKDNKFEPYPHIKDLFCKIQQWGHKVGIISQNPACDIIYELISLFHFGKCVDFKACFVGPKQDLVRKLQQVSNYSYDDILYLDDEYYDIPSVMELNVTSLLSSEGGVTWDDVQRGLAIFTMVGPWREVKP